MAKAGGNIFYIDINGHEINFTDAYEEFGYLSEEIMAGRKGGKWQLINKYGKPINDLWYDTISGLKKL